MQRHQSFGSSLRSHSSPSGNRAGFSIVEVIVTIGIIVLLMAILLPALASVRGQARMASSMNHMKQIAVFMQAYSSENRDVVLPSRFDYSGEQFRFKGRVKASSGLPEDQRHRGTWADILWTENRIGAFSELTATLGHDYSDMAPDRAFYEETGGWEDNIFRSTVANSRNWPDADDTDEAYPFGEGAWELGLPGYFAANNMFDVRPGIEVLQADGSMAATDSEGVGRWIYQGQLRSPERTMYLVDSYRGSVIEPMPDAFDNAIQPDGARTIEVDFRYAGSVALMLMLDGSVRTEQRWTDLCDLECWDGGECGCSTAGYANRGLIVRNVFE